MANVAMAEVLDAVQDVDFPADRDELVAAARTADARDEVVLALQAIPPEQYNNETDVAHSVRLPVDSDLDRTAGQRNEQVREGGKHGLSAHLREVPKPPVDEELDKPTHHSGDP